jgi:anti-sigma regulatory factor (Ser/Thr protein kinase)
VEIARIAMPLTAHDETPRAARRLVGEFLLERGIGGETKDAVSLVVDELVSNAVVHSSNPLDLEVSLRPGAIRLQVRDRDSCDADLHPQEASAIETHGRGLSIVDALSERWGADYRDAEGKTVWAEIRT